ncbi:MAG: hypothetical protein V4492_03465 [Chlamydiota bacterium]
MSTIVLERQNPALKTAENDFGDHLGKYANPGEGSQDFFRVVKLVLTYLEKIPCLSLSSASFLSRATKAFTTLELGIKLPYAVFVGNGFRQSLQKVASAKTEGHMQTLTSELTKEAFLSGTFLTNTLSEGALFFNHTKLITYGAKLLRNLNIISSATCLIMDGADLAKQYEKLREISTALGQTQDKNTKTHLESERKLTWITIAQDVSSIALSSLLLLGIALGAAVESATLFTGTILLLGTSWLTFRIAVHFYDKMVVEPNARALAVPV